MKKLVLFGTGQIAELAHFYFSHDSDYEVVAFAVDGKFLTEERFCRLPVVPFEEVEKSHPALSHCMFVAVSYAGLNQVRTRKVAEAREKGYALAHYLSSRATVWSGFEARENSFILEDNTIQPFATIGENCTLWSGNHIGHHSRIADNCFITSHVVISGNCTIGERSFIGVNATLRDGLTIGEGCLIGAGVLVLKDAPDDTLFKGAGAEAAGIPASRIRL